MLNSKIDLIRSFIKESNIQALIIPTSDPHKSEYIADYWKCREWISGFTGSAGTLVITASHAGLWTDSRYFVQAQKQLTAPFVLHKLKTRTPEYIEWVAENLVAGDIVGVDPELFAWNEIRHFLVALEKKNIQIKFLENPFEHLWIDRPALPAHNIAIHDDKFNGLTRADKINKIHDHLRTNGSDLIIISALDDIAWLLNLRGTDIKFNPVFRSFVVISLEENILFTDLAKITEEVNFLLKKANVLLRHYNEIIPLIQNLKPNTNIEYDGNSANFKLINSISSNCIHKPETSIVSQLKSVKTPTEITHYKNAQIRDGVAMCNFISWHEKEVTTGCVTEVKAAKKSEEFRCKQKNYMGLSFDIISAYQENAALPHYSPSTEKPVRLKPKGLYLIDSGAQYLDGTTDITRTIALGPVTKDQIIDFTLVLKGHIRLAMANFPAGTKGFHLDTLARLDLWEQGKDFGHGTGHGIGYFLNVHEGPQGFSQASKGPGNTVIEPGMFITNEPGYYFEGKYGIRIENVLVCVKTQSFNTNGFLKFETVTYCPIDKKLIDKTMLSETEINWINNYHRKVFDLLSPMVTEEVYNWLIEKTSPF